jgi:hypothetical protein
MLITTYAANAAIADWTAIVEWLEKFKEKGRTLDSGPSKLK